MEIHRKTEETERPLVLGLGMYYILCAGYQVEKSFFGKHLSSKILSLVKLLPSKRGREDDMVDKDGGYRRYLWAASIAVSSKAFMVL